MLSTWLLRSFQEISRNRSGTERRSGSGPLQYLAPARRQVVLPYLLMPTTARRARRAKVGPVHTNPLHTPRQEIVLAIKQAGQHAQRCDALAFPVHTVILATIAHDDQMTP